MSLFLLLGFLLVGLTCSRFDLGVVEFLGRGLVHE